MIGGQEDLTVIVQYSPMNERASVDVKTGKETVVMILGEWFGE